MTVLAKVALNLEKGNLVLGLELEKGSKLVVYDDLLVVVWVFEVVLLDVLGDTLGNLGASDEFIVLHTEEGTKLLGNGTRAGEATGRGVGVAGTLDLLGLGRILEILLVLLLELLEKGHSGSNELLNLDEVSEDSRVIEVISGLLGNGSSSGGLHLNFLVGGGLLIGLLGDFLLLGLRRHLYVIITIKLFFKYVSVYYQKKNVFLK